jgi:hypothetical protein
VIFNIAADIHVLAVKNLDTITIIYFGHSHFTSRNIMQHKKVWAYDGQKNNGMMTYDGLLGENTSTLQTLHENNAYISLKLMTSIEHALYLSEFRVT